MFIFFICSHGRASLDIFTLPNMPVLCTPNPGMVRAFTLPEVNRPLELEPQSTLPVV